MKIVACWIIVIVKTTINKPEAVMIEPHARMPIQVRTFWAVIFGLGDD